MTPFQRAMAAFDAANSQDPHRIVCAGRERPAELVYAERMSAMLDRLDQHASDNLKLAARAQHLRRWAVPRSDYPMDRAGYLRWRSDLKRKHAEWAGEILGTCGFEPSQIARIGELIRKERLKIDAEAQTLEDVACLVFLEHYAGQFVEKHAHEPGKLAGILRKTWAKMSERGRAAATDLKLSEPVTALLHRALEEPGAGR